MILRRLAAAIRRQDWFTVFVETMIVVLGVFLGLQVQQWAGERAREATEAEYVARLHDEVVDLQATRGPVVDFRRRWYAGLETLGGAVFGAEDRDLTIEECSSIVFASVVTNPTDDLATLIELQASGGLSLFQDARVLDALRHFLLTRARVRDSREGIARSVRDVIERHPALIRMTWRESPVVEALDETPDDFALPPFECDVAAMRMDKTFESDVEWNRMVVSQHVDDNRLIDETLAQLHGALDQVLGIVHGEKAP
ncbi:MAG: hypothetical protein GC152_12610 [Alphaproteobacteria bacterium]|nr:hypothetical protein [Alphaproteobacteria bacterium]